MKSTFALVGQRLVLRCGRRDTLVADNVTPIELQQLAESLVTLALEVQKAHNTPERYLLCSPLQQEIIYLLGAGYCKKQIARRCHASVRTIERALAKIKDKAAKTCKQADKPNAKNSNYYLKIPVTNIPFSLIRTDDDDDQFDLSDNGAAADKTWREIADRIEDSDVYHLFDGSPRRQELIKLMVQGYSPQECRKKLGVSMQAIYQQRARIKQTLQKKGYATKI